MRRWIGALMLAAQAWLAPYDPAEAQPATHTAHAIAIHGEPKYGPDFRHLDYVNPDAPKGGEVILGAPGAFRTFDSLNPFILRGVSAGGLLHLDDTLSWTYDTLTVPTWDDPEGQYGLVAASIEVPEDRSWVVFTLRPEARFHDGRPITAADVAWTFETLISKGHPQYRLLLADVDKAEAIDDRHVKFTFKVANNRELPIRVGGLAVLPKHYWQGRDFEKTTLEPPLGSGPYRIEAVEPGRSIRYRRVEDYWGRNLPINVGRFNFGVIRYDYYRDPSIEFEAFKTGALDYRREYTSKDWATGYEVPALRAGLLKRDEIKNQNPGRAQGFLFNTRRPVFQDRRVRQALGYAFDFEWMNKTLFYGIYARVTSYWSNSELAAAGLPKGAELALLERYRGRIADEVFAREYKPPQTDGSGNMRENVREALKLLSDAGWLIKGGKLVNAKGEPFQFEILYVQSGLERLILPFVKNLERLGIQANARLVDSAQYQKRVEDFDFDMVVLGPTPTLSPGNDQRDLWSSAAADTPGSANYGGVKDPVIDELVELVIAAPDRDALIQRTRALDRVLLWSFYMVPQYYGPSYLIAYWDKFGRPPIPPKYGVGFETWWVDAAKAANLEQRKAAMKN
ncbi:MAG: ABC transporter substrate-binding protein [Proteobacteria bacterium]|nr:ABC transporter substrate-binding protein [Pseudomonadota bacterium]MBI3496444.1 ABC transporter substrate-binding protein [Pseudomonadota bacterium]